MELFHAIWWSNILLSWHTIGLLLPPVVLVGLCACDSTSCWWHRWGETFEFTFSMDICLKHCHLSQEAVYWFTSLLDMLLTGHLDYDPDPGLIMKFLMYGIICGHSAWHLDSDPDIGHIKKFLIYDIICRHSTQMDTKFWVSKSLPSASESESSCGVASTNSKSSEAINVFKMTAKRLLLHLGFILTESIDE